jgi:anion transporter
MVIAPLSPSTTAKAFLLLPICVSLVEAFDVEKGRSNYGAAVMLMAMTANNICSTAFLTATVPNPISAAYLIESLGLDLGWIGWLRMAFPITLLLLAITLAICLRLYRPEVRSTTDSLRRVKAIRESLGPIDRGEQVVAVFFVIALFLWITESLHGLNAGLVSLVLALFLFLPRIGVMKLGGFAGNVPWGSLALFAASMFLARAVGRWRALDPVALGVFRLLNLTDMQPVIFVFLVVLVSMFIHVVFTSTTVYATLMVPLVLSLTQFQGLNAGLVALPVAFLTPVAVILPVNTIPNLVFHSSGYVTERQMITYGLVASLVSVILTLLVGLPYWRALGLV